MDKITTDLEWLTTTLDCGDNSCLFRDRTKPGGMRTNGGCRCFDDLKPKRRLFVHKMFQCLLQVKKGIHLLKTEGYEDGQK